MHATLGIICATKLRVELHNVEVDLSGLEVQGEAREPTFHMCKLQAQRIVGEHLQVATDHSLFGQDHLDSVEVFLYLVCPYSEDIAFLGLS